MSTIAKKIVIAGGSGFLGQSLSKAFVLDGSDVVILTRKQNDCIALEGRSVIWDAKSFGSWSEELNGADVLINLTGKSIDCRHTPKNKKEILYSRIQSTRVLGEACSIVKDPPRIWLNASTATVYEDLRGNVPPNDEFSDYNARGFSEDVGREWENAFFESYNDGIRKVALRISIVLGKNGGAFPVMCRFAKLGLGGKQGPGTQWVSWLHIDDWVSIVKYIILNDVLTGPINLAAPNPTTNSTLMNELRSHYAPFNFGFPTPSWAVKLGSFLIGTAPDLVLKSRKLVSKVLSDAGYKFTHDRISSAIRDLASN